MNGREYYRRVLSRLKNCFQFSHYAVASGSELATQGDDPAFPGITAPLGQLEELTTGRELQIHIPLIGERSRSVLMPLDFEISLGDDNCKLYLDKGGQRDLFAQVIPLVRYLENFFRTRGLPYLLDYTPSGGHILFQNLLGYRATDELKKIGFLEGDLIKACEYIDPADIRRWYGVSLDAALIFSGLGKIAEYIALSAMAAFRHDEGSGLPITISDSLPHCLNFDNTWNEGSPFMRHIRSPFSLHRKNQERYGQDHRPPLVDVIGAYFDGKMAGQEPDIEHILDCMWDLEKAAEHAQRFSGFIPCANESLLDLIAEYRSSDLFRFHQEFEGQQDFPRGQALERARKELQVPDWARNILHHPNPAALQPKNLVGLVYDFLIRADWQPRHIANILRDLYQNPRFHWNQDFYRYPAEEKANFWARTYSALALFNTGRLAI